MTENTSNTRAEVWKALTPAHFAVTASRGRWTATKHLIELNLALTDTIQGVDGCRRLIVTMPPRHGKSELCCKYLPAWFVGTFPDKRVILTGYGDKFVRKYGRATRDLLTEWGPSLFNVRVRGDNAAADTWGVEGRAGGLDAAGCMGTLTGLGADLMIVDDPIKNAEEANSEVYRDRLWDWWESTASTRFEPNAAAIVIHTRWNHDDLIGRLLQAAQEGRGPRWRVLNLPAIGDDGAALWPERYPLDVLEGIRSGKSAYWWSALYQQNPTPREGLFFQVEKLKRIDAEPAGLKCWRGWDIAYSANRGDYTAGVKIGKDSDNRFVVTDVVRGQWSTDKRNEMILHTAENDGHSVRIHGPQDPGAGKDFVLAFARLLAGFSVKTEPVGKAKEIRADGFSAQVNAGNVSLVRGAWNKDFIEELRTFPAGAHDDQVDAASDAFNELAAKRSFFVVTGDSCSAD